MQLEVYPAGPEDAIFDLYRRESCSACMASVVSEMPYDLDSFVLEH
jgi:hypothetical protein